MLCGNKKNKKDDVDVIDESSTQWSVSATDNPDFVKPPEVFLKIYLIQSLTKVMNMQFNTERLKMGK